MVNSSENTKSYRSIEYMRGLAAFFVAYGHLTYAFFDKNYMILDVGLSASELLTKIPNNIPALWKFIPNSGAWVNVFFLISGFVIELSIQKIKPLGFFIQRILRIYPVFWVGFLIQIIVSSFILNKSISISAIYNFFLLNDSSVVTVSWTLLFELYFYIFICIAATLRISIEIRLIIIQIIFWVAIFIDIQAIEATSNIKIFFMSASFYISWMSIGTTVFYFVKYNCKYYFQIMLLQSFFVFLQFSALVISPTGSGLFSSNSAIWYAEAFAIFIPLVIFDKYIIKSKILSFLGKISYPLYCVHYSIGWAFHYTLIVQFGFSPLLSLLIVFLLVILSSWSIHKMVEQPAQRLSKRLTIAFRTTSPSVVKNSNQT